MTILLILLNYKHGFHIIGLDNASPFFDISVTLHRIFNSPNLFEYGGQLFTLPFTALRLLAFPSWLISQLYVWGALLLGMYCYAKLFEPHLEKPYLKVLLPILLFANLIPIWIFSQPIYLFVSSFVGIPALICFLQNKELQVNRVILFLGVMYFLATSVNPIAFVLYLIQGTILAILLQQKTSTKEILRKAVVLFAIWLLIMQGVLLLGNQKNNIFSEFGAYIEINSATPLSNEVTQSLRTAELKNNSITNVLRYATGWLELNDVNNTDLFRYSRQYANNYLMAIIGLLPSIAIFLQLVSNREWRTKNASRLMVYGITVLISSTYALLLIGYIPYVRDGLRWISSKTWPTLYVLGTLLFIDALQHLPPKRFNLVVTALSIILIGYALPWWNPPIINNRTYVKVPSEYLEMPQLNDQDTLIVYPQPQKLFFRSYEWGYYGTDFLSYITKAKVVDGTSIHRPINEYAEEEKQPHYFITENKDFVPSICNETVIETNDIFKLSYCEPIAQE